MPEFQAKLFGQELLGFGQPNLIYCLSKGQVDKKILLLLWQGSKFHLVDQEKEIFLSGK